MTRCKRSPAGNFKTKKQQFYLLLFCFYLYYLTLIVGTECNSALSYVETYPRYRGFYQYQEYSSYPSHRDQLLVGSEYSLHVLFSTFIPSISFSLIAKKFSLLVVKSSRVAITYCPFSS